ncbi:MAG: Tox-REase-5 domain-containing protein [Desulfobulbaceae bacterium]|nr:Tox-REase-5 domain-containing protein [Desulfobulbaceae bacterium]
MRYKAWGETRYTSGSTPTIFGFTGQRQEVGLGLYFYNARWYDPALGRFIQPDSIIPDPGNPLDWDRYQYARSNPLKYADPDGHIPWLVLIGVFLYIATIPGDTGPYEVDPATAVIGDAGLRMADPVDWAYTVMECLSGNCSGTDILFGILPIVNGGLDDAADAARAVKGAQATGKWVNRSEHMSGAARAYQRFISGREDDLVYEIGGYTFDSFDAGLGILKDAKDIPANFVNAATNEFKPWVSGTSDWLKQAQNQVSAAGGLKIQWFFNSQAARDAMYNLFLKNNPDLLESIELIFKPIE